MAGRRVSFLDMAGDEVADEPGVSTEGEGHWLATARCRPNPRNPRDDVGDLSDLETIKERQLQSCLAITPGAYLKLWPEDEEELGAGPDDVVIINGNRRRAAALEYGRERLFVVVDDGVAKSKTSVLRAAYDENTGRQDFDPIEEARAVVDIVSEYATAKEAATAEGWSQAWISHRRNLLKLHPELQKQVKAKARGGDGLSINVARRLGSVKGIEGMDLDAQREALEELLRGDAEAAATKKAARRKKSPAAPGGGPGAGGGAPVPGPRGKGSSGAEGSDGDGAGDSGGAGSAGWLMPADKVREFSALFVERAAVVEGTPDEVMRSAYGALRDHYRREVATSTE